MIISRVAKQVLTRKEFSNLIMANILFKWEACMTNGLGKVNRVVLWSQPHLDVLKVYEDGVVEESRVQQVLEGYCITVKGEILCKFSKGVGIKDSNKAEALAILQALRICSHSFQLMLIVECDSRNGISWVTSDKVKPQKLQFYFNNIIALVCHLSVEFHHVVMSANGLANS